jgi:hypothetical protein
VPILLTRLLGDRRRRWLKAAQLGHEARELAAVAGSVFCQQLLRREPRVVGEQLDERLVGDPELGVAAPAQHGRPRPMQGPGDLGRQARLADARLADDEDRTALAVADVIEHRRAPGQLVVAVDQPRLAESRRGQRRQRHLERLLGGELDAPCDRRESLGAQRVDRPLAWDAPQLVDAAIGELEAVVVE